MDDLFEKIISREIPAEIVYEDDMVTSFLDINPINKGHLLVVPNKKFVNIFDADEVTLGHMMQVAQKLAIAVTAATDADGVNIFMNNVVGQEVPHAHLHVIPRFENDHAFAATKHEEYNEGEASDLQEQIKKAIG